MPVPSTADPLVHEALRACRLFAGLDEEGLALVTAALRSRRFRRGTVIFHEGDPGDSLSIVAAGSVKILVTPEDGLLRFADDVYRHDVRLDAALQARSRAGGGQRLSAH